MQFAIYTTVLAMASAVSATPVTRSPVIGYLREYTSNTTDCTEALVGYTDIGVESALSPASVDVCRPLEDRYNKFTGVGLGDTYTCKLC